MADDLDGLAMFVAVAEAKGFRAAGDRLGVSGSAVSQAMRRLEQRLGVALVQRTTRSVRLTAAGERLYAAARPALDELRAAVAAVGELSDEPRGVVRLHVSMAAESYLSGTVLTEFLAAHPHVRLDLFVSDEAVDIVAAGYDAGIRLGEVIDRDMIAVPVSGDLRLVVVGAPSYFARHPKPTHPRDLAEHACINWHPTADAPAYRWEFTENGRDFSVAVPARVLTNDPALNVRLAAAGAGLTLADESRSRDGVASGALVPVLEAFSTPFPGFYLYYPQRRHASPALRALVDFLREARAPKRATRARSKG
jgi:DNA-binding transcriptional LysR family regulator